LTLITSDSSLALSPLSPAMTPFRFEMSAVSCRGNLLVGKSKACLNATRRVQAKQSFSVGGNSSNGIKPHFSGSADSPHTSPSDADTPRFDQKYVRCMCKIYLTGVLGPCILKSLELFKHLCVLVAADRRPLTQVCKLKRYKSLAPAWYNCLIPIGPKLKSERRKQQGNDCFW
jgi:hypothetical protein